MTSLLPFEKLQSCWSAFACILSKSTINRRSVWRKLNVKLMNVTLRMLKNPKWSHPASIERTQLMHYFQNTSTQSYLTIWGYNVISRFCEAPRAELDRRQTSMIIIVIVVVVVDVVIIIIIKITNSSIVIGLKNSYFPLCFTYYYYYKDDATKRKIGMHISPRSL